MNETDERMARLAEEEEEMISVLMDSPEGEMVEAFIPSTDFDPRKHTRWG